MMKRILHLTMFMFFLSCAVFPLSAQDVKELIISKEQEDSGKALFTFRFTPGKSQVIKQMVFEFQYHQEFPFEDSTGKKYTKIHEPAVFRYTLPDVKFVDELDKEINFRVPMRIDLLKVIYGEKLFKDEHPVTISCITISAFDDKKKSIFEYKLNEGEYKWDEKSQKLEIAK